jgi:hypothetical protein
VTSTAGVVLVASFALVMAGALMFVGRGGANDPPPEPQSTAYLGVERSLIMAAVVATGVGLLMLAAAQPGGRPVLLLTGSMGYGAVGVVLLYAETASLVTGKTPHGPILVYVVGALLAQALVGIGLLGATAVADWVAWTAVVWSLGWLAFLLAASPGDLYFPVAHHLVPLVIGVALLQGSR